MDISTQDLSEFLLQTPFFASFPDQYMGQLLEHCTVREIKAGETFLTYQAEADQFNLIYQGTAELGVLKNDEMLVVSTLGPKDYVGWSALIPPHTWCFDAQAKTDMVLICLSGEKLRELSQADFELGSALMTCVAKGITGRLMAARVAMLDNSC